MRLLLIPAQRTNRLHRPAERCHILCHERCRARCHVRSTFHAPHTRPLPLRYHSSCHPSGERPLARRNPRRRSLDLQTIDAAIADVEHLYARGYQPVGSWTLSQTCDHLSHFIRASMDGFPPVPLWMRLVAPVIGPFVLGRILRKRQMPEGVPIPGAAPPAARPDERSDVDQLIALLRRLQRETALMHPSPMFGKLDRARWTELHLIHAAHHLSFLIPRG